MNPIHSSLIHDLKALPRAAWFLYAGTFINRFGAFVIPFLAIYIRQRGFTEADAALALTCVWPWAFCIVGPRRLPHGSNRPA